MTSTTENESNWRYEGWRVTAASSAAVFFSFASLLVYTFSVFLKPLANTFGWSRESVSLAFGLAAISVAICSPFIGTLLDRIPPRRILLPCFVIFGTAFASLGALTPHLAHLYLVFVLLGIVGNGTAHLSYTGAISTWFERRRGTAFALLLSGGAFGAMVLPPIAQWLIDTVGWRWAFATLGFSVLLCALPLASRVRRREGGEGYAHKLDGATVSDGLRSWRYWIILAVLFAASISQNGAIAHLSAILTDRGVTSESAAIAVSALGAATLVGRLVTGWLLDRFFAPRVAFFLLCVAALGTYLVAQAHSAATGWLGAALIGVGLGGEADVTPYLLTRYFGLRSFSTLYGISWTAYAIAGGVGPVIMGRAFDLSGSYATLLTQLSVFTVLAATLMLFLPRYKEAREWEREPVVSVA